MDVNYLAAMGYWQRYWSRCATVFLSTVQTVFVGSKEGIFQSLSCPSLGGYLLSQFQEPIANSESLNSHRWSFRREGILEGYLLAQHTLLRDRSCWHTRLSATPSERRIYLDEITSVRLAWFIPVRICNNELSHPRHMGQYPTR